MEPITQEQTNRSQLLQLADLYCSKPLAQQLQTSLLQPQLLEVELQHFLELVSRAELAGLKR
jgi:hypothetical protein